MGFAGDIWPVHHQKDEVAGDERFRSIADLLGAPDATFIGVNRNLTIDMICKALRERGAGARSASPPVFARPTHYDADGSRLQDALIEAAGDMPMIGPNCYGLINYADGALLWPDQHGGAAAEAEGEKGAAIITQSSTSPATSPCRRAVCRSPS